MQIVLAIDGVSQHGLSSLSPKSVRFLEFQGERQAWKKKKSIDWVERKSEEEDERKENKMDTKWLGIQSG